MSEIDVSQGAFASILKRNNKQIRDDRATSIVEDAEKDVELGVEIRNTEIKYNIVKARYEYLFGIRPDVVAPSTSNDATQAGDQQ